MMTCDAPTLTAPDGTRDASRHYTLEWELGEGHIAQLSVWYETTHFRAVLSRIHRTDEGNGVTRTSFGFGDGVRIATIPSPTTRFSRKRLHEATAQAEGILRDLFDQGVPQVRERFTPLASLGAP